MARLCEKELCTGCTACASACPLGCITMQPDAEGFLRPVVEESRCTGCGLCGRVCPVLFSPDSTPMPQAFAAKNKDETVRGVSTSGGVFTLLAQYVLDRGGVFSQVKALLAEGRKVLFSGTPCQVAGLRSYLGRDDDNLLLVDLVCHGVPSPAVWERYLAWRSEQAAGGVRPATVNLRSKDTGWSTYSVDIRWPYGKSYLASNREDPFIRAFVGDLCLRPSCHRCSCKGLTRCADFTLGDYWGVWDQLPSMSDNGGTSIVLVHSQKAKALWEELSPAMTVQAADARRCMEQNPAALQSAPLDRENRALFLHRYESEDFAALVDELLPRPSAANALAHRVAGKLKRLLKI